MKLSYVYLRSSQLICFRAFGPYEVSSLSAWQQMCDWLDRNCLRGTVKRGFGMAHDDPRMTPPDRCRYDACIDLPELLPASAWAGLLPQQLPGGAYARCRHVGPHTQIGGVVSNIRQNWSDSVGITLAVGRPLVEIYLDDPKFTAPERLRTDICLPVAFTDDRAVA